MAWEKIKFKKSYQGVEQGREVEKTKSKPLSVLENDSEILKSSPVGSRARIGRVSLRIFKIFSFPGVFFNSCNIQGKLPSFSSHTAALSDL